VEAVPEALLDAGVTQVLDASRHSTPHRRKSRFGGDADYLPDQEFEGLLDQDAPRYVKGERVLHATFGSGAVLEVSGFGKDTKVTVDFDSVGRKKLLVRYAELERDWTA